MSLLALCLCACNAFDESRLLSQRFGASEPNDAGMHAHDDSPAIDAASQDDPRDTVDDGPQLRIDASELDDHALAPDEEPQSVCDDEDAGAPSDTDGDGLLDCVDACPSDPAKTQPGLCGCSHPDDDVEGIVSCKGLRSALAHRWRFEGTGNVLRDERGSADALVKNAELSDQGSLALEGGTSGQYVDLPNSLLAGMTNMTIEAWVTWTGSGSWQRIFDFGNSDSGMEDVPGVGQSYLMLSPSMFDGGFGASFADSGPDTAVFVEAQEPFPSGSVAHVAVVFDDSNDQLRIYLNGRFAGSTLVTGSLSSIADENNWLGRSQWDADAAFSGSFHELRIYDRALTDAQLSLSHEYGADPTFLAD